jgi:hypothetical protein
MMEFLFALLAIAAYFIGWNGGRRVSLIAFGVCALAGAALSVWTFKSLRESGLSSWEFQGTRDAWTAGLGVDLVLACIALIGPIVFRNPKHAIWLSLALIAALIIPAGFPLIVISCVGFAICI